MLDSSNLKDKLVGWNIAGPGFSLTIYDETQIEEMRKVVASYAKCDTDEVTATKVYTDMEAHPDSVVRSFSYNGFGLDKNKKESVVEKTHVDSGSETNAQKMRRVMDFLPKLNAFGDMSFVVNKLRKLIDEKTGSTSFGFNVPTWYRRLTIGMMENKITEDEVLETLYEQMFK